MATYKEKIAQNILSKLNAMNMNYTEFCQKSGIGHSEISKMKNNPERITIPFLLSVANGIGCGYADLFRSGKGMLAHLTVGPAYLQRIKTRREQMGYSTRQLAVLLDVRVNSYEHFEAVGYSTRMTPEKFEKLMKALELNHTELRGKVTNDHAKQQQLFTEPKPEEKPEVKVPELVLIINGIYYKATLTKVSEAN
jgi:transcriptional regulator with XRE-family HTH domain